MTSGQKNARLSKLPGQDKTYPRVSLPVLRQASMKVNYLSYLIPYPGTIILARFHGAVKQNSALLASAS